MPQDAVSPPVPILLTFLGLSSNSDTRSCSSALDEYFFSEVIWESSSSSARHLPVGATYSNTMSLKSAWRSRSMSCHLPAGFSVIPILKQGRHCICWRTWSAQAFTSFSHVRILASKRVCKHVTFFSRNNTWQCAIKDAPNHRGGSQCFGPGRLGRPGLPIPHFYRQASPASKPLTFIDRPARPPNPSLLLANPLLLLANPSLLLASPSLLLANPSFLLANTSLYSQIKSSPGQATQDCARPY